MQHLHENQKKIMEHLLEHQSGATADQLAEVMGVTKTAAKQHIDQLIYWGYLAFSDQKGSIGRPKRSYFLSVQGAETFPRQYSWLSSALLKELSVSLGAKQVVKVMRSIADNVSAEFNLKFPELSVEDRLVEIIKLMNDLGYKARLKSKNSKNGIVIEAANCVYHDVAKNQPELCGFDIRLLENTSKLNVSLETCIARGGNCCRFCLR